MSASETRWNWPMKPPALPDDSRSACGQDFDAGSQHRRILSLASVLTYSRSINGDHPYLSVCGNTLDAFGWEPDRLVTDPGFWRACLHPEDAPRVLEALESLPELGMCSVEYRLRRGDGEYGWSLDRMALLRGAEGDPVEIVGYLLDISCTKELEHELRHALLLANAASQAKSDFLSNMSHELTTPLNAVIGFAEVLQDRFFGSLNPKQDEYVTIIRKSGQRLLALLTDILLLSKFDAGDVALELAPASPAVLLRASLAMKQEKAVRHTISMDLDLTPEMDQITPLDEVKFRQVLLTLLGNAMKFTPDNGWVRIEGRRVATQEGESLVISVEDSGPGIPIEFASSMFTPFIQLERPQTKTHQGVGLGLALARQLARLQGGEIELADTSTQNSRMVFTLPVRDTAPGAANAHHESLPAQNAGTPSGA